MSHNARLRIVPTLLRDEKPVYLPGRPAARPVWAAGFGLGVAILVTAGWTGYCAGKAEGSRRAEASHAIAVEAVVTAEQMADRAHDLNDAAMVWRNQAARCFKK